MTNTTETFWAKANAEPYRIFFPLGILYLLWGIMVWVPQIWQAETFPLLAHRFLVLNGFSASFIVGFLMTAVPKFAKTPTAEKKEIAFFAGITLSGIVLAYQEMEQLTYACSALQSATILTFLFRRIHKRKENPPYSFVFIFAGLFLWLFSSLFNTFSFLDTFKLLHYEGSIAAIILGVGSRLVPGILGHSEIVQTQRSLYENERPFIMTVPLHFYAMIISFVASYFLPDPLGIAIRSTVVVFVGLFYWKLYHAPREKSALTWNIWGACWLILFSFVLKLVWRDGVIHASHSFFLSGIVLLSLLIATRVLQSHGPKDKRLENLKLLYVVSFFTILAGATRVSAFLMPEHYLRHLGYSSVTLMIAILLWSYRYLRFVKD